MRAPCQDDITLAPLPPPPTVSRHGLVTQTPSWLPSLMRVSACRVPCGAGRGRLRWCIWRGALPLARASAILFAGPLHLCTEAGAFYLPLVLVGPPALSRGLLPPQSPTRPLPGQRPDEPMSLTLRLTNFPRSTCWNWGRGCDQARKRSKQAPAAAVRVKGPALPQGACLDRPRQLALHARGLGMRFSPGRKIWCDLMRRRTLQGKAGSRERSADSHSMRA
jgi:hypothetical protein